MQLYTVYWHKVIFIFLKQILVTVFHSSKYVPGTFICFSKNVCKLTLTRLRNIVLLNSKTSFHKKVVGFSILFPQIVGSHNVNLDYFTPIINLTFYLKTLKKY